MVEVEIPSNLLDALVGHARTQGEATAFTFLASDNERSSISFRDLERRARGIAQQLLNRAEPGDRALLMYPAGLDFITAFLGCLFAGIIAVPAYPPKRNRNAARLLAMARDCQPKLLLCTRETFGAVFEGFSSTDAIATDELDGSGDRDLPAIDPQSIAFLQYTSGSTSEPKGVMVTHANIMANEESIRQNFQHTADSVMVSWLPMFHDMGLIGGILQPLYVGFPSVLMAPNAFLTEPVRWLRAISDYGGTTSGGPNFAYQHCVDNIRPDQKRTLDLSKWFTAYNGAEPVRAKTLQQFSQAFADCGFQGGSFFPCYGLAEATLFVSGGPPGVPSPVAHLDPLALENHEVRPADSKSENPQRSVSCGRIAQDLEVRIMDPATSAPASENRIGEIWITGSSIAAGYWKNEAETSAAFHAEIPGESRSWFRTGDLGFLRGGELYVTGRLKDVIIVRGRNIYPQDIEILIERSLGIANPNSVAAFAYEQNGAERLGVVVEATRSVTQRLRSGDADPGFLQQISRCRESVTQHLEIRLHDIEFLPPGTFPRTSSGKVQRRACRDAFLTRSLPFLPGPSSSSPTSFARTSNES